MISKCSTCSHNKICNKKEIMQNAEKEIVILRNSAKIEENNKINFDAKFRSKYDDLKKKYGISLYVGCDDYEMSMASLRMRS